MKSLSKQYEAKPNETIWQTYLQFTADILVALGDDRDTSKDYEILLNSDGVEVVADLLEIEEDRVREVVDAMLDPSWSKLYTNLIFPLERAYSSTESFDIEPGYVYLMYDPASENYKIGKSVNPKSRLSSLNAPANRPDPDAPLYELIHHFPCIKYSMGAVEDYLKEKYADLAVNGEWFDLGLKPEEIYFLVGLESDEQLDI